MIRLRSSRLVVLPLLLMVSACASAPPSQVSRVAFYGGRILEAIHTIQRTVAAAEIQKVISTETAGSIMIFAFEAGEAGQKLADVLALYDMSTKDRADLVKQIAVLTQIIDQRLTEIGRTSPLGASQSQITQLVANALQTVVQLRAAIPGLLPNTLPPPR